MRLSIIIPMYNVSLYVEKCVRSCLRQDIPYSEYEIILVNDGSTDNTLDIVQSIAREYPNIHIVDQENAGLSIARNVGLSKAAGEYVWFIDSDDWIEDNILSVVLEQCVGNEVVAMGYIKAHDNPVYNRNVDIRDKMSKTGVEFLATQSFYLPAQLYVFNRHFLKTNLLSFYPGIYHEDMEFTPRMLYVVKKIAFLSTPVYYFYVRPNSITTTINPKKSFDLVIVANRLRDFCVQHVKSDVRYSFDYMISLALNNSLYSTKDFTRDRIEELSKVFYNNRHLFVHLCKSKCLKYIIEGCLFRIFPNRVTFIYRFLQMLNPPKSRETI